MPEISIVDKPLDFIHHLEKIMKDPTFRSFFDEYFKTWGDTKATLMVMKAYLMVESETKRLYNKELSSATISEILRHVLMNAETRRYLVESMEAFMTDTHRQTFNQICHQVLLENHQELAPIPLILNSDSPKNSSKKSI